jgi:hypothetical protein
MPWHVDLAKEHAMSQIRFADADYAGKRKKTRREVFRKEMEQVVPWKALLKVIEPYYPQAGRGRRPYPIEAMLRVHLMQNWFALSEPRDGIVVSSGSARSARAPRSSAARRSHTVLLPPRDQTAFRPGEGALQGAAEEHGAPVHTVRTVEPVDGAKALDGTGASERSVRLAESAETSLAGALSNEIH